MALLISRDSLLTGYHRYLDRFWFCVWWYCRFFLLLLPSDSMFTPDPGVTLHDTLFGGYVQIRSQKSVWVNKIGLNNLCHLCKRVLNRAANIGFELISDGLQSVLDLDQLCWRMKDRLLRSEVLRLNVNFGCLGKLWDYLRAVNDVFVVGN